MDMLGLRLLDEANVILRLASIYEDQGADEESSQKLYKAGKMIKEVYDQEHGKSRGENGNA